MKDDLTTTSSKADLDAARVTYSATSFRILNEALLEDSVVLCVGEAQVFDARFRTVYNTVFDYSIFEQLCAEETPGVPAGELPLRDTAEIRRRFREAGITHVFVNWQEIMRYRNTYGYTDFVTPARFAELQQRGILGEAINLGAEADDRTSVTAQVYKVLP